MWSLSVTIITRDEVDRLGAALESVRFADEVVVLDSGSTDGTVALARGAGARVIQTDWPGHVAQKTRAVAEARHPWVLCIDADERVSAELAREIQALRAKDEPGVAGFTMPRLSYWLGRPIRHGAWYPDRRPRLFHRERGRWAGRDPHDQVELNGAAVPLRGHLEHHPYRSLTEHLATQARYAQTWAESAAAAGVRAQPWDLLLRPPLHLVKALLLKRGLLDGLPGWVIAGVSAGYVLQKWTHLWLAQRSGGDPHSC